MSQDIKALKALAQQASQKTQQARLDRQVKQQAKPVLQEIEPAPIKASQVERVYRDQMEEVYAHLHVPAWKAKEISQAKKLIERYPRACLKIVEWAVKNWEAYVVSGWVKGTICIGNILVNADRLHQDQQEDLTPVQRKVALQDTYRRERDKWREFQGGINPLEGEKHETEITAEEIDW